MSTYPILEKEVELLKDYHHKGVLLSPKEFELVGLVYERNSLLEKLKTFMVSLECENVEEFMEKAETGDYKNLGEAYVSRVKKLIRR